MSHEIPNGIDFGELNISTADSSTAFATYKSLIDCGKVPVVTIVFDAESRLSYGQILQAEIRNERARNGIVDAEIGPLVYEVAGEGFCMLSLVSNGVALYAKVTK